MGDKIRDLVERESLETYDLSFLRNPDFGGWRIEKDMGQFIGKTCETFRPPHVLEFGAGLSTLIFAHEAFKGNVKKIWSIDYLLDFPGHPRDILVAKGQDKFVHFCLFPIKLTWLGGKIFQFYSIPRDFFRKIGMFDLVFVDGPPYYYNSREAALYAVYPYLSPKGMVLLDDANRKNREQVYLKNWRHYFGRNIDTVLLQDKFKKGLACIWKTGYQKPVSPFTLVERFVDSWVSVKSECFRTSPNFFRTFLQKDKRCYL